MAVLKKMPKYKTKARPKKRGKSASAPGQIKKAKGLQNASSIARSRAVNDGGVKIKPKLQGRGAGPNTGKTLPPGKGVPKPVSSGSFGRLQGGGPTPVVYKEAVRSVGPINTQTPGRMPIGSKIPGTNMPTRPSEVKPGSGAPSVPVKPSMVKPGSGAPSAPVPNNVANKAMHGKSAQAPGQRKKALGLKSAKTVSRSRSS